MVADAGMEYRKAVHAAQSKLLERAWKEPGFIDDDIFNLIYAMLEIMPQSLYWRMGQLRSMRAAILALAKERGALSETKRVLAELPRYNTRRAQDN